MTRPEFSFVRNFAVCIAAFVIAGGNCAVAQTETVLHAFQSNSVTGQTGSGTVFQLAPPSVLGGPWKENILYSFLNGSGGAQPLSGVIFDRVNIP